MSENIVGWEQRQRGAGFGSRQNGLRRRLLMLQTDFGARILEQRSGSEALARERMAQEWERERNDLLSQLEDLRHGAEGMRRDLELIRQESLQAIERTEEAFRRFQEREERDHTVYQALQQIIQTQKSAEITSRAAAETQALWKESVDKLRTQLAQVGAELSVLKTGAFQGAAKPAPTPAAITSEPVAPLESEPPSPAVERHAAWSKMRGLLQRWKDWWLQPVVTVALPFSDKKTGGEPEI